MNGYFMIFIKSLVTFIGLLIISRFMGRKHLAELTYFDYIVSITIGSIAANVVVDRGINPIDGIIGILAWGIMPLLIGYLTLKNLSIRKIIDGEPLIIIKDGKIFDKNLAKTRYHIGDLMIQLRQKEIFDISEVECAILEPNGRLSVLKKSEFKPVTPKDLNINPGKNGLMVELVINGQIIESNLEKLFLSRKWLLDQLKVKNITKLEDVIFGALLPNGQLYVAAKNSNIDNEGSSQILQ